MAFGKNYEQPMFTKILSSKDPQRRIESCIAPGLPAEAGEPGEKWLAYSLQPAKAH